MNSKINLSFGVVLLGIFSLSFALHANADSPFCNGAETEPIKNLKPLCLRMVGGAKTWEEAATYAINRIARKANRSVKLLGDTIEAKLLSNLPISKRSQIMDICKNGHMDAIENLQASQKAITNPPFSDLASRLTSVYTSFEDCRDAIVEEKGQPDIVEVTRFNNRIQRMLDVALVIAKQDPRIKEYNDKLDRGEFKDSQGDPSLIGPIVQSTTFGANEP